MQQLLSSLHIHKEKFPEEGDLVDGVAALLKNAGDQAFHNYHWEDGHITGSLLSVNPTYDRVLLMFHKKLSKWVQFGGHSDDSPDVLGTALREFHEESGIALEPRIFSYYSDELLPIFDIDIHDIPADIKGRPDHRHYDMRFLGVIPDDIEFARQEDEVDDIQWFDINEAIATIDEP